MVALRQLADERGLFLIEDAAHAVGGQVWDPTTGDPITGDSTTGDSATGDRATGTIGHAGAFSFFANKNLPLGEGGMVVTADAGFAARARLLRSHGLSSDTWARHQGQSVDYEVERPDSTSAWTRPGRRSARGCWRGCRPTTPLGRDWPSATADSCRRPR